MSGIGWTEFFFIALILLIFVGPQRLPELFGKIAWMIAQLRSASRDLRNQIDEELVELKQVKSDFTDEMKAQTDKLYAEARKVDEEYRTLQENVRDDLNDVKRTFGKGASSPQDAASSVPSTEKNAEKTSKDSVSPSENVAEASTADVANKELKG